jgi:hypothetical protein
MYPANRARQKRPRANGFAEEGGRWLVCDDGRLVYDSRGSVFGSDGGGFGCGIRYHWRIRKPWEWVGSSDRGRGTAGCVMAWISMTILELNRI